MARLKYPNRSKVIWRGVKYRPGNKRVGFVKSKMTRRWFVMAAIFVFFVCIIGASAKYFLFSNNFLLEDIQIRGANNIATEDISLSAERFLSGRYFKFIKSGNYFAFQPSALSERLEAEFPKIAEIRIERDMPDTLTIEISERVAVGVWCDGVAQKSGAGTAYSVGDCFYIDNEGVIFDNAPRSSGAIVFSITDFRERPFKLGSKLFTLEDIAAFQDINKIISRNFSFGIKDFYVRESGSFEIITTESWKILLGSKIDSREQLSNLKYVLDTEIGRERKNLEYVDLRLGNKVYYKLQ